MENLFQSEATGLQLQCGNAVRRTDDGGKCKNPECSGHSPALLGGYCTRCASAKGVTVLKACGFQPIRLTEAASRG